MKQKITFQKLYLLIGKKLALFALLAFTLGTASAQFVNGNLGTGTTTLSGVTAPAGTQWHEMQGSATETNVSIAFDNSPVFGSSRVADNFAVPAGVQWNVTKMTFYAVVLPPPPGTSPITEVRIIIRDASPVGPSNIIYGDLTTNRLSATSFANIYAAANTQVPAPGTPPTQNFVVWKVEANVNVNLPPGNYWVEWQTVGAPGQRVFALMSQPIGARTLPGYNAVSTFNGGPWQPTLDLGNPASAPDVPVDFCFGVDYTASPCLSPTSSVLSQVGGPLVASTVFSQNFDAAIPLPAGWDMQNRSNPIGPFDWRQGPYSGIGLPANSGVANSYIASTWSCTTTSGVGTVSNWLFAPNVTLKNGDQFSFYTRTLDGVFPDRLEVRMSTNGTSTNVGTTEFSVGDFGTVLLDINPTYTSTGYPTAWTKYTITLSGLPAAGISGRLAFRHFVTDGGGLGTNSEIVAIDDVLYQTFNPTPILTCTGSTANLKVDITGGNSPYTVVINRSTGGNFTVTNYISGTNIPVTPAVTTTYSLVSVTGCGVGTGNSGTPTITVSPTPIPAIVINDDPTGPLCAGSPKLLTVNAAPGISNFTSATPITINTSGPAAPYPSNLAVSGLPVSGVTVKSVTINGISHTYPSDIDIILQSPTGQNVILMSDIGGSTAINNLTYTFDDASAVLMAQTALNPSGTYHVTNRVGTLGVEPDNWPAPGPGTVAQPNPALASFTGDPNGTWKLFIVDDFSGDGGSVSGGFSITFSVPAAPPVGWTYYWTPAAGLSATTGNPVAASPVSTTTYTVLGTAPGGCQTTASITINVNQLPAVTSQPSNTTVCTGSSASFTVAGTGAGLTYQWQVSTTGAGGPWINLTNTAPYSGVNTSTLTINPVAFAMNGYRYRCSLGGTCSPAANSIGAILTVNALPVITINPAGPVCGGVAGINGTALTASGAGTYTWSPLGGLFTNATATTAYTGGNNATVYAAPTAFTTYTVTGTNAGTGCSNTASVLVNYTPPAPVVSPSSVTMCLGDPAVRLTSSTVTSQSAGFSSGPLNIAIPDNTAAATTNTINVSGIPAAAIISAMTVTLNMPHTYPADMVFNLKAPNGQVFNLYKHNTNTDNGPASIPTAGFYDAKVSSSATVQFVAVPSPYRYGQTAPVGPYRADALNGVTNPGYTIMDPAGYVSTAASFAALYSIPNGTWTLAMCDGGPGDLGTLLSWRIDFTYLLGVPATAAVWTPNGPGSGLFTDAAALNVYNGTPTDTVWTKPTPSGIYPYQVTVQSLPVPATPVTTPMAGGNGNFLVAFNVRNNNTYAVKLTSIASNSSGSGAVTSRVFYKTTPIAGNPGAISAANGWVQFGTASNNVTAGTLNQLMSGLSLSIPPGATYGIALDFQGATNPAYTNGTGTIKTYSAGGCDIITDGNVGWGGPAAPGTPANNPRNFNGSVGFAPDIAACTSPARTVIVTVNQPTSVVTQPVNRTVCTDKVATFSVVAGGSGPFSYQWQESTNTGNTWSNISNGGVYAGATSATLTITAPPVSMSGYMYRCVITGAAPCASINSFQVLLTVNPLPTVVISASPYTRLYPGLRTTLSSTVSPAAAQTYQWFRNGAAYGGNTSSLNLDVDQLGLYQLTVTDVNNCTNTSNSIDIRDSAVGRCFIYPNPTNGEFDVRYYSVLNNSNLPRTVTVYNASGNRILTQRYSIGAPYQRMHVDLRGSGKGLYWVEVGDANGNRLTMCRVVVQ